MWLKNVVLESKRERDKLSLRESEIGTKRDRETKNERESVIEKVRYCAYVRLEAQN